MATAYRTGTATSAHGAHPIPVHPPRDPVTIDLCTRIGQIEADLATLSMGDLCRQVDRMRSIARRNHYLAAADIAANLSDVLARDGRAALIRPHLSALREACGCARGDRNAVHALLASISVRFAD